MSSGFNYFTTHKMNFKESPKKISCTTTLDDEAETNLKGANQKRT